MRSLWSGVSGLQAHQIAMDVEANNIANVNTYGYKYGRASFADMLSQTKNVATAPQGESGGKNAMQIGLGTQINAISNIFSQGSIETTDKNTDVAIQGEGFFVVSPDGGDTYKYTRAGDFKFDADGNFVDNNGYIVQGWLRDEDTGTIDTSASIRDIQIKPGMTTPAQKTSEMVLKANLNSGDIIENSSPIYSLKWGDSDVDGTNSFEVVDSDGNYINDPNIQSRINDMGVLFNSNGEALSLQQGEGIWMSYDQAELTQALNDPSAAGTTTFAINGTTVTFTSPGGEAVDTYGPNLAAAINSLTPDHGVQATYDNNTDELRLINTNQNGTDNSTKNIKITGAAGNDGANTGIAALDGTSSITAFQYTYDPTAATTGGYDETARRFTTTADMLTAMQNDARYNTDYDGDGAAEENDGVKFELNSDSALSIENPSGDNTNTIDDDDDLDGDGATGAELAEDHDMNLTVTGLSTATVTENEKVTDIFSSISGNLASGSSGKKLSQSMYAATHSASIDIYDSLGSKHTLKVDFTKAQNTTSGGTRWDMEISVPKPATIDGEAAPFENLITYGFVTFDNTGSLSSQNPTGITFSPNNGAEPSQTVKLDFGSGNFDGLTSFNKESSTGGTGQDGYPGGDLEDIRIDQSGTLIGSFSNGRSFGLAQLSMAKFANNEGLMTEGGNLFSQSANSGDPIIGTAATGGKGFIQSSSLEMSNVDLSRSLTKLITVQRGFQANSKTITTSDQMLNTLLGLKQ